MVRVALICLCAVPAVLHAQEFKLFDRTIQYHGFASQGFIYTNDNNWLTMHTSQGSGAFTDFGANASMRVTDRMRLGVQGYDRNLGNLGEWHPSVDWAFADYQFKTWFGVRGGKVKTVLGLYNDTQDLDFLHTFALLPQSVYPTDLRDATIAHLGESKRFMCCGGRKNVCESLRASSAAAISESAIFIDGALSIFCLASATFASQSSP